MNLSSGANGDREASRRPTTVMEVVSDLEQRYAEFWPVQAVLQSIRNSAQGVHGRYLERLRRTREQTAEAT